MEQLIAQLRILKEMDLKPNYSALAREYGCDRRTVKKYNNVIQEVIILGIKALNLINIQQ